MKGLQTSHLTKIGCLRFSSFVILWHLNIAPRHASISLSSFRYTPSYVSLSSATDYRHLLGKGQKLGPENLSAVTAYPSLRTSRQSYNSIKVNAGKFRRVSANCRAV